MYRVILARSVVKDIKKLPVQLQKRVHAKLEFYAAQDNPLAFAKPLKEPADAQYRFRVGHYRVLFDLDDDTIIVLCVQHRKDVYR